MADNSGSLCQATEIPVRIKENEGKLVDRSNKLISEVISLILIEGKRNWKTGHYDTYQDFIISVIDSHLYNEFKKNESKERPTEEIQSDDTALSPEQEIAYQELKEESFEFLKKDGADDDELMVFDCMADGVVKPKYIRADLGISIGDFHNVWRRLKKRLIKLQKKLTGNG